EARIIHQIQLIRDITLFWSTTRRIN
ncbi:glutamate decarboxylase, partial [Shigella dysenteriae]